jgi:hypothetical protein
LTVDLQRAHAAHPEIDRRQLRGASSRKMGET